MRILKQHLVIKITLVVMSVVALGFSASTIYSARQRNLSSSKLLHNSAERMAQSVAAGVRTSMLSGNGSTVREMLADATHRLTNTSVRIYAPDGREVFGDPGPPVPPKEQPPHVRSVLSGQGVQDAGTQGMAHPIENEIACRRCHEDGEMRGVLTMNTEIAQAKFEAGTKGLDALARVARAGFVQVMTGKRDDFIDAYFTELARGTAGINDLAVFTSEGDQFFGEGEMNVTVDQIKSLVGTGGSVIHRRDAETTLLYALDNEPRCQACHEDPELKVRGVLAITYDESRLKAEETVVQSTVVSLKHVMLSGLGRLIVAFLDEVADTGLVSAITLHDAEGRLYHDPFTPPDTPPHVADVLSRGRSLVEALSKEHPDFLRAHHEDEEHPVLHEAHTQLKELSTVEHHADDGELSFVEPLLNEPRCQQCHGGDRALRGAISVSLDVTEENMSQRRATQEAILLALVTIILVVVLLYIGLRAMVLQPVRLIGAATDKIGNGDLNVRVDIPSIDEIGRLADRINDMAQGLRQKIELQKFVSEATLTSVTQTNGVMARGVERRRLSVLFSDIRGFTAFSETREPEEVVEMLNAYLQVQAEVVSEHGGDIDKFIGDELMARFSGQNHERRAALCAVGLVEAVDRLSAERREQDGESVVHIGVGVNSADVVLGAMGSSHRMDFTVIGDGVNLAARLCSAAKPGEVLISQNVNDRLGADAGLIGDTLDPIQVKGKRDPIPVYRLSRSA